MSPGERGGIIFRFLALLMFTALLGVVYLARYPLLRAAGNFWVVEDPLMHADAIVVLGDDDFSGDRAARAADLFREGDAPVVVASGRRLRPYAGIAELIAHDLQSDGVPSAAVVPFDHDAADTREEAMALRGLAAQRRWRRLIVVTSNYHTRRARYIFLKVFPAGVSIAVASSADHFYDPDAWWEHRPSVKIFFLESVAYAEAHWES
jgi:uncharacterized SAM-binding protein YcdF (DUF218 family)